MSRVIYFVRHGQTDWNAERRFQGQIDIPLNDTGRAQAHRNGSQLAGLLAQEAASFDFVSSPLQRARQTMRILRQELGLEPDGYHIDGRLLELHYGDWQGLTERETEARFPELHDARMADKWNFVPPGNGAESYAMQAKRFSSWFDAVQRPTICVSHGGIMRCVLHLAGGWDADRAGRFEVPQDRILRCDTAGLSWL